MLICTFHLLSFVTLSLALGCLNSYSISYYPIHISYIILACLSNILKYLGCVCNVSCLSVLLYKELQFINLSVLHTGSPYQCKHFMSVS